MRVLAASLLATASAKVYFEDNFDAGIGDKWVPSEWKDAESTGKWVHTAGEWYAEGQEAIAKGMQASEDMKFHSISAPLDSEATTVGKPLVIQFTVKHEKKDYAFCGGGYIKLLPGKVDPKTFGGDTPYSIMFGPDICGGNRRVHVILEHEGTNHLISKTIAPKSDELTHVYTLILKPDNTYQVLIDSEEVSSGSLDEHWEMLPPKTIPDPDASKPEDWVDEEMIEDPEDVKPEGWDDIPEKISDPEATKPDDWDDEDDGEWEAPMIPNPDYKGPWSAKIIKNPEYKGPWEHPEIDNPEYEPNDKLYIHPNLKYIGFELWQVKSGTIFDNILVTDDIEYAKKFADDTYGKVRDIRHAEYE